MKVKKAKPTYAVGSQYGGYFWHMLRGTEQEEAQNVHQGKTCSVSQSGHEVGGAGVHLRKFINCVFVIHALV